MEQCMIESHCPFKEKCQQKNEAEFCSYHRTNYIPPSSIRCPIHPQCHYAFLCDIPTESKHCKNVSSPPPYPLPTPRSFIPFDSDKDDSIYYLD